MTSNDKTNKQTNKQTNTTTTNNASITVHRTDGKDLVNKNVISGVILLTPAVRTVTAETSVAITTVTVSTVDPGLVTVFSRLVAVFLTDWIHTWRYTEGTLDFISIHTPPYLQ